MRRKLIGDAWRLEEVLRLRGDPGSPPPPQEGTADDWIQGPRAGDTFVASVDLPATGVISHAGLNRPGFAEDPNS